MNTLWPMSRAEVHGPELARDSFFLKIFLVSFLFNSKNKVVLQIGFMSTIFDESKV